MFRKLLHEISAERMDAENPLLPPFFYQQQKAYSFCMKFAKDKDVLEVGSGSGYGTYRLAKVASNILGIDSSELAVNKSKEKYKADNLNFIWSKIEDYRTKQEFDVVIALQVLEHLEKPELFLRKVAAILKKEGLLLITTPNSQTQSYNENPYHYKEYSFGELRNFFSKYFREVNLYGISGNSEVRNFERARKDHVLSLLSGDRFKLRRFLPRKIKQLAFDLIAYLNRFLYQQRDRRLNREILEDDYKIAKENEPNPIDIIAVCRHLR
ncbi:MAG: hypothetical protein A2800_01240 [Candidatus Levybacteria bacterium RIFCSPHIGHO2_01_FULL_40_16]|nr:MAG: hypothetical protein A2800_01240 [Candidatus Levybacteria bacterium RIFCSPHIGHO2_01_FULL_40_16]